MTELSLNQFFLLFMWFPLTTLLIFLLLIARFYERFSKKKTYFRWFLFSILVFGVAIVRYASQENLSGDKIGDLAYGTSGLVLGLLCLRLYRFMIVQQNEDSENA